MIASGLSRTGAPITFDRGPPKACLEFVVSRDSASALAATSRVNQQGAKIEHQLESKVRAGDHAQQQQQQRDKKHCWLVPPKFAGGDDAGVPETRTQGGGESAAVAAVGGRGMMRFLCGGGDGSGLPGGHVSGDNECDNPRRPNHSQGATRCVTPVHVHIAFT